MDPDGPNPAFQQAIPHGMDGIGQLFQVVIFGSSWESRNGLIWGPEMVSFGDRNLDSFWNRNEFIWGPKRDEMKCL